MSEHDLIHLFLEIAAIREYDGGMSREEAEKAAYYDWRKIVGRVGQKGMLRKCLQSFTVNNP